MPAYLPSKHHTSSKERAQAIAEFAIVLPILLMILVGLLEVGRMLFVYASVTNASREAARYASAVNQVEQARAALKQARADLAKTTIYSPMTGTVSALNKAQGEIALGSQFQKDVILVVADLNEMEAEVNVDESDVTSIAVGQPAEIEVDALLDQRLHPWGRGLPAARRRPPPLPRRPRAPPSDDHIGPGRPRPDRARRGLARVALRARSAATG